MHPSISHFPSLQFYGGRLLDGPLTGSSTLPPQLASSLLFLPVPDGRESIGASKFNQREIDTVMMLLDRMLGKHGQRSTAAGPAAPGSGGGSSSSSGPGAEARDSKACGQQVAASEVGVITPYKAQAERLQRLVGGRWPGVEINTVDAFQGREKQVIIVSTVRANCRGALGFVTDRRRMNVALTRAVRALVVVGHEETLSSDELWGCWLRPAARMGGS